MQIKEFLRKILNLYRCIIQGWKYGGVVHVNISEIKWGNAFSPDDVILVSGGSKGIGRSITCKLLGEGATVIATGRDIKKLNDFQKGINNKRLFISDLDISKPEEIVNKVDQIETEIGKPITALINNAGIYGKTSFPNCSEEDAMKVFTTNALGTLFLSQELCKRWEKGENIKIKKIINISSQGGFVGANNAYRMSKWAIRGLTEHMGIALSNKNIIVNGIAPGFVMTDMQPAFQKQGDNYHTELNPVKRIALPNEIAELVTFLLTDAANFIVGQTICCDGGYSLK